MRTSIINATSIIILRCNAYYLSPLLVYTVSLIEIESFLVTLETIWRADDATQRLVFLSLFNRSLCPKLFTPSKYLPFPFSTSQNYRPALRSFPLSLRFFHRSRAFKEEDQIMTSVKWLIKEEARADGIRLWWKWNSWHDLRRNCYFPP